MSIIGFSLGEERDDFKSNITVKRKLKSSIFFAEYLLNYPCEKSYECTYYQANFPIGKYRITLCGANGGVLTAYQKTERKSEDFPYAAGCTSGIFDVTKQTKMYIHLGGHGMQDGNSSRRSRGGYNGGGSGNSKSGVPSSGGGGSSDIRADVNDLFHRIIVAGGGGGGDDSTIGPDLNDGSGGSGGGLTAQGWHTSKDNIDNTLAVNQTFGFSFGQGEAGKAGGSNHPDGSKISFYANDLGGAGGGWFGGFASHHDNYGAGGGSSFALTEDAVIPETSITVTDENWTNLYSGKYAFSTYRMYLFYETKFERGVWFGNGYAQIFQYKSAYVKCVEMRVSNPKHFLAVIYLLNK